MELTDDDIRFDKTITKRRTGNLDRLMATEAGRSAIDSMIHFIASRASVRSAAARIGVNPNTLTKWIMRGKKESDGVYRELYDRVVIAIGHATAEAEVEVNNLKPEFYLRHGPARILIGDAYNTELPGVEYNIDGTIGIGTGDNPTGITETDEELDQPAIKSEDRTRQQDNQLLLEALAAMRANNIDVNSIVDDLIAENNVQNVIGVDSVVVDDD